MREIGPPLKLQTKLIYWSAITIFMLFAPSARANSSWGCLFAESLPIGDRLIMWCDWSGADDDVIKCFEIAAGKPSPAQNAQPFYVPSNLVTEILLPSEKQCPLLPGYRTADGGVRGD